ncbi:hypothetical protein [Mucilaginibacter pallidiroseus]|nr:hypothetical protein [Mucilaginibacter pallidiroseus]
MKRSKLLILVAAITVFASSCGIFKKDCNCPHFGKIKVDAPAGHRA